MNTNEKEKKMIKRLLLAMLLIGLVCPLALGAEEGWIELFNGTLDGWQRTENMDTWTVKDGLLITHGERSHLFYVGPVENADFRNFELKVEVKTEEGSNSGIYFHTKVQKDGWPNKGYEVQVNNTHSDWRKTGGLYGVEDLDVKEDQIKGLIKDGEWFTEYIRVQGKRITIKVKSESMADWKTTVDWVELPKYSERKDPARKLSSGTFALQGHDPKSVVYYRSVKVKPLPPRLTGTLKVAVLTGGHDFEQKPFTDMLNSFASREIKCTEIKLKDHSEIFEDIGDWDYDVIVMYNMTQNISEKRQANFKELLDRGIGFVSLHHNMGAFQNWPEFMKIAGGRYQLQAIKEGDKEIRGSTYKHDIDLDVKVADKSHPITRGLKDFQIHDEGYKYCRFEKDNRVLLTAEHDDCDRTVAWVSKYKDAKVCGIMLGHDGKAYENESFRKLLSQAILWTAGRLK